MHYIRNTLSKIRKLNSVSRAPSLPHPSRRTVKKHIALLMFQAMFIVLLAITYVGIETRTQVLEASVPDKVATALVEGYEQALENNPVVLGEQDEDTNINGVNNETENQEPEPTAKPTPTEEDIVRLNLEYERLMRQLEISPTPMPEPPKDKYVIAVYGDSMVDTMGEALEYLHRELQIRYPDTDFRLYNYGIGSENIHDGIARWKKPLRHIDRDYRPITEIHPDIIIVGSFAYNVLTPHDRNAHWLGYTELVKTANKLAPGNVYMLAEIIPCRRGFGFGPNGVNWEPQTAWSHTGKIIEQLENVLGLAETLDYPLIDAYTPSQKEDSNDCRKELVNPSDNIHPSVEGHTFIAKVIADTIVLR